MCYRRISLKPYFALADVCHLLASGCWLCMSFQHPLIPRHTCIAGGPLQVSETVYSGGLGTLLLQR